MLSQGAHPSQSSRLHSWAQRHEMTHGVRGLRLLAGHASLGRRSISLLLPLVGVVISDDGGGDVAIAQMLTQDDEVGVGQVLVRGHMTCEGVGVDLGVESLSKVCTLHLGHTFLLPSRSDGAAHHPSPLQGWNVSHMGHKIGGGQSPGNKIKLIQCGEQISHPVVAAVVVGRS